MAIKGTRRSGAPHLSAAAAQKIAAASTKSGVEYPICAGVNEASRSSAFCEKRQNQLARPGEERRERQAEQRTAGSSANIRGNTTAKYGTAARFAVSPGDRDGRKYLRDDRSADEPDKHGKRRRARKAAPDEPGRQPL